MSKLLQTISNFARLSVGINGKSTLKNYKTRKIYHINYLEGVHFRSILPRTLTTTTSSTQTTTNETPTTTNETPTTTTPESKEAESPNVSVPETPPNELNPFELAQANRM